jgi:hypothetical protein
MLALLPIPLSHVKIRSAADVRHPDARRLLEAARRRGLLNSDDHAR